MKNVQEWLNDKPMLLALTSLEWIYIAPDIYKYLQALSETKSKIKEKFPIPPINEWIEMYQNPSVIPMILGILTNMNPVMGMLESIRVPDNKNAHIMEISKQAFMTPTELKAHEKTEDTPDNFWLMINKMRLDSMKEELSADDDTITKKSQDLLSLPIFVYVARVLIPSILLYQRNPQELFKEAKDGKLDSLAKLLVIDKEILRDETIFGFFNDAAQKDKELDYNMLTKAFRQTPADLVSLKKVKVAVARFILDISKVMGRHFTMNEIRDLYNNLEKDREGDNFDIITELKHW